MLRRTYAPALFETELCSTEVSMLCSTIVAPGIAAPLGSRITPFTEAVETWAPAEHERARRSRISRLAKRIPRSRLPISRARPLVSFSMNDLSPNVVRLNGCLVGFQPSDLGNIGRSIR